MTGVIGWCYAKPWIHDGIVSTGTEVLLAWGRNMMSNVKPLAASGDFASGPIAAASPDTASTNASSQGTTYVTYAVSVSIAPSKR